VNTNSSETTQDTDLDEAIRFCMLRSKEAIDAHDWTNLDYWNARLHALKQQAQGQSQGSD
jgi:hypothetical protein